MIRLKAGTFPPSAGVHYPEKRHALFFSIQEKLFLQKRAVPEIEEEEAARLQQAQDAQEDQNGVDHHPAHDEHGPGFAILLVFHDESHQVLHQVLILHHILGYLYL